MTTRAIHAQRNLLVALARHLTTEQAGGLFDAVLELLGKVLPLRGALVYRAEPRELVLAAEHRLPRRGKPWLSHLARSGAGWFVAQRAAHDLRVTLDDAIAVPHAAGALGPALAEAGWGAVAAAPMIIGRRVRGVLVVATATRTALDAEALLLLDTVARLLALAEEREAAVLRERDSVLEDAAATQLAAVGLIAATAARELAAPLEVMQLELEQQDRLLRRARPPRTERARGPASERPRAEQPRAEQVALFDELDELSTALTSALATARGHTSRLLALSRETRERELDLTLLADAAVRMLVPAFESAGVELAIDASAEPLLVVGREEMLSLALVELLLYMKGASEGGRARRVVKMSLAGDETRVRLTVESSGGGGATSARVFDAIVQRSRGATAAMGLALAKQTVLLHKGHVEHGRSTLGGALATAVFPRARRASSRAPRASMRPGAPRGRERGVVVWLDADESTALAMKLGLKPWIVTHAANAEGARELLDGLEATPHAVFCDLAIEGAVELHAALSPAVRDAFVWMTSGVIPARTASYLVLAGRPTLIKPLGVIEVTTLLGEPDASLHPGVVTTLETAPPPPSERATRLRTAAARRRQSATIDESPAAKQGKKR